jgi:diguanylate cyclase (GGDEF)-like protein/putative nucleotidyltransferase with HDIG domain
VIAVGSVAIAQSVLYLVHHPVGVQWFILAALTIVSGSASVKLPSSPASISISETFVITAVLLFGPAEGTVLTAIDGLVISFWLSKRHDEPQRALFNVSAPALSAWCSAHLFFLVARIPPLVQQAAPLNQILPGLTLFALTYFGLNSWLVTFAIAIERRSAPLRIWRDNFLLLSLNYFAGASVAILLVGFTRTIDLGYIGIVLPLLLILYFTFQATMSRIDDANKHVEQLNRLYLSTIETFAMAIDAKDQVTHGHIRRVQQLAMTLAGEIGIHDESLLKAIEAAALLHDMGKLAVPEYILNKPGKLTHTEFEKMKLHAGVGADILSAVDFPYPVVPIVRHHHENWDGTGYPAGLKGTDIPIGARILSVVDCFDALTSDRPYRPRLSDEEAMRIVFERRGTMYDPLVVDTFARIHNAVLPDIVDRGPSPKLLKEIAIGRKAAATPLSPPALDEISASADEMLTLYELARGLAGRVTMSEAGDIIANHLRRLVPSSLGVFYIYDKTADDLEARHVVGEGVSLIRGLRIPLGQRLSGWVAANRQTICNSDPVLDLGDAARVAGQRLRHCLSTPMLDGEDLIGVLSLYTTESIGFSDDHRRVIEVVGHQIAHTFKQAIDSGRHSAKDPLTALPSIAQLEQLVRRQVSGTTPNATFGLLLIDVLDLERIVAVHGVDSGEAVLRHVLEHTRGALRIADILFRNSDGEFVAFLHETDSETTDNIAGRVRTSIDEHAFVYRDGNARTIRVAVTSVCASRDRLSVNELFARAKLQPAPSQASTKHIH